MIALARRPEYRWEPEPIQPERLGRRWRGCPEGTKAIPVSIRVPADVVETLDKVAGGVGKLPAVVRSCCAPFRQYLADEGREVLDVQEGIAELDRGEFF